MGEERERKGGQEGERWGESGRGEVVEERGVERQDESGGGLFVDILFSMAVWKVFSIRLTFMGFYRCQQASNKAYRASERMILTQDMQRINKYLSAIVFFAPFSISFPFPNSPPTFQKLEALRK